MNFIEFRTNFVELGYFNVHQVYVKYPDFDRNNLTRWVKMGYLEKLRQGYYAFLEYLGKSDFALYLSNRIYKPSYVSLHTALAFYGIIPEAVTQITAVSSLKTAEFTNAFGLYSYKKVKDELLFGYELKPYGDRTIQFAYPEKAILDLLYLYPFYNTAEDMENLRFDEYFMSEELNIQRLKDFLQKFRNKALDTRVQIMLSTYGL
jgi:predicted transcriptional regulator of viral defense system